MDIKKSLLIIISLSVLFVLSCNKADYSPQSWEEYQTERKHMLLTTMLSSFSKNYPSHSLPMDTTHAYPFERNDGTRVLSIRLKASVEEYGVNADALEMPDSIRERYMKNSVWLTVAEKNDTMSAVISVSIPTMEYMDRGAKKLPYVSIVHPQEFSGDMIILNVEGKYMGRYLFEHGIPDAEREPLTVKAWDKVSTKGGGEEEDYPCGWYDHWRKLYWLDEVVVTPPKDQNEEIYPPITPQEDPAAFCTMYPLMCEECERCGSMKIDCMCTPENEEDDDDESGGLPPTDGENDGDDSGGGGNGNNGDGSGTSIPPSEIQTSGDATIDNVVNLVVYCIQYPYINNLISQNKIFIYNSQLNNSEHPITMFKDEYGQYKIFINPTFWHSLNYMNQAFVLVHEFIHILIYENIITGDRREGESDNDFHHRIMIENNVLMMDFIEAIYSDMEESFYDAMSHAGATDSPAFKGLDEDTQDTIEKEFKKYGIIF